MSGESETTPLFDPDVPSERSLKALANLIERITPWLFAVGSWVFGGLIAFDLVVLSSLMAIGSVDAAILVSVTAFACALPLNVAGIVLLRLTTDLTEIEIDHLALQAFKDADFPDVEAYFPSPSERASQHKRRAILTLRYALGMAALSGLLTLIGLIAALSHVARWIAAVFLVMVVLSTALVVVAIAHALPPESEAEKEMKRRYRAHVDRQARKPAS